MSFLGVRAAFYFRESSVSSVTKLTMLKFFGYLVDKEKDDYSRDRRTGDVIRVKKHSID